MTNILDQIKTIKKGTYHKIKYVRTISNCISIYKDRIKKETTCIARIGCNYSNLSINKDKQTTNKLPYGQWYVDNKIIEYKDNYQLRLTKTFNNRLKPQVIWYLDNEPVDKDYLINIGAMKEDKPHDSAVFNIKVNDIVYIK